MANSRNHARDCLSRGDVALGFGLRLSRTVECVQLVASCDYDWLFIDLEHGPMSVETAADLCIAALGVGIAPLARVPVTDYSRAARMLDSGAWGVILSHVETPQDAADMVTRLKFPPVGHRSVSYGMPQLGFQRLPVPEATRQFNEEMLIVAMVESPKAVANAADIISVPGIDALFLGCNDLSMDMGIPGDFGNPKLISASEQVIAACAEHGKWPGIGGVYADELLRRYVSMGMKLILAGTDMALLGQSARRQSGMVRRVGASESSGIV